MNLLGILIFLFASAHARSTVNEQRTWLGLFGKKALSEKNTLWAEAQLRHDVTNQTMNQTLNRFGVLRTLSPKHEAGLLFAYVQTNQLSGTSLREYRPTAQYVFKSVLGSIKDFSARARIEYRMLEDVSADSVRTRLLLRYGRKLSDATDFVFWEEPFVNVTREDWTGRRAFERNRAFMGVRQSFNGADVEVGYMNQFIPRTSRNMYEHILVAYLFY